MSDTELPESESDVTDRDRILALLETGIDEAHRKVKSGRVYDPENEKVRIQWIRALGYIANVHRQVQKDKDLDELEERIAQIESSQQRNDYQLK
jgi:adenylate cyclase class IV